MDDSADHVLETEGLSMSFGGFAAVRGLDLRVRRGSVHALIGPNGAGKTTVFNLLTRFLNPTSGRIRFNGRDVTRVTAPDIARLGVVRSFQTSAVFGALSVHDNVRIALQRRTGLTYRFWKPAAALNSLDARASAMLVSAGLGRFAHVLARNLPYGRKRMLEIATTLALEPEVLLLDEPIAGLGQEDIKRVTQLIRSAAKHRTVLMVEHNLSVVEDLSDTITVLARGQVLAEGDYASVSANPCVREAYLGGTQDALARPAA